MSIFFFFEVGVCLWLAIAGVLCIGMAVEPTDGGSMSVNVKIMVFTVAGVFCIGLVVLKAFVDWGMVALAAIITLVCGLGSAAVNVVFNRVENHDWIKVPTPLVGTAVSLCAAIFICALILPTVWGLGYENYSYGSEVRGLEYVRTSSGVHLVEKISKQSYSFQYTHKSGDAFGNRRYSLGEKDIVWLDEDDEDERPRVEGEVTAMAKIDPISGRPIETPNGKIFRPTTLYIRPSDVANTRETL